MNGEINKIINRVKVVIKGNWIILIIISILVFFLFILFKFYQYNHIEFSKPSNTNTEVSNLQILIVGDMMLDRNVRNIIDKKSFDKFFINIKKLVQSVDIAVANLEGTFTVNPSVTTDLINKDLKFTFNPNLAPALEDLGFDVLGLANNHSYNFGKEGLESTRRYIGSAGMLYYGDPFNKDEISTIIIKNGVKVGFVGFHEFNYTDFDKVFFEVAKLRKEVDVLIVSPHWGVEYQKEPTTRMVEWAHQFIDYGADAVIGAHPHIVGSIETYKGKKIYYSLGNFVFDQYFSEATMNGLAVKISIEKFGDDIGLKYRDIPIKIDREGVREGK